MKTEEFIKTIKLINYLLEKSVFELMSHRSLVKTFELSDAKTRLIIKKLISFGLIYSKGKNGYAQNKKILDLFLNTKYSKQLDFIENEIVFLNARTRFTFNLYEFLEVILELKLTLDSNYGITEVLALIIIMHSKYSIYGCKDVYYNNEKRKYNILQTYFKTSNELKIIAFSYEIYDDIYKINI